MANILGADYQELALPRFGKFSHFFKLVGLNLRANSVMWLMVLSYIVCGRLLISTVSNQETTSFALLIASFFLAALPLYAIGIVVQRFIYMAFVVKPEHPIKELGIQLKDFFCCPQRMANGIPMMVMTFMFANQFGQIKDVIPLVNPFQWDETFMALDRSLHFGFDPWVILQPIIGYAPVTVFFDWMYFLWIVVIYSIWASSAFSKEHTQLRTQFMFAFFLSWAFVGNAMAIALSSAGPVFYAKLGLDPSPYAGLMYYLSNVNEQTALMAVQAKDLLWDSYIGLPSPIGGITAMPSMHNCSSILVAIYAWQLDRRLGIALTAFAGIIFIGSIHLGWHYAVDGYVAGIAVAVIWWVSGKFAAWCHSLKPSRHYKIYENRVMDKA